MDVDLYKYDPENLAEKYKHCGENEWYFFTPRDRKYPNGSRPSRGVYLGSGFWKATGADRPVKHNGVEVGKRKALVYFKGKPPKGEKTDWIMHEYRLNHHPHYQRNVASMRLDECVLCRIYKKANKSVKTETADDDHPPAGHHEETGEEHLGVDCGQDNVHHDPTMYTNTYGDYIQQPYHHGLPQIPPYSNTVAFGN
ncbi:NAM domain-containing protein, partial [Cephalotus follicularis]